MHIFMRGLKSDIAESCIRFFHLSIEHYLNRRSKPGRLSDGQVNIKKCSQPSKHNFYYVLLRTKNAMKIDCDSDFRTNSAELLRLRNCAKLILKNFSHSVPNRTNHTEHQRSIPLVEV